MKAVAMRRQRVIDRREDLGLTREEVAYALDMQPKSYERFELGRTMVQVWRRPKLARVLRWSPEELRLAIYDGQPDLPNGQSVPKALTIFASLEQGAAKLDGYEPVTVHGLLQTADYAVAVERSDALLRTEEGVAKRVQLRMARQCVLTRDPDPLRLSVILDESALRRVTGSHAVMAGQLQHLADIAELSNIDLAVLPFEAGQHSAGTGTFQLLTSPDSSEPHVVCVEDRSGVRYIENDYVIDLYGQVFTHLRNHCLPPVEALNLIRNLAKEYQQ